MAATSPAAPTAAPSLLRRIGRRAKREAAGWRRTTVREPSPRRLTGQRLRLVLPDPAALARLAASGQLTGQVCGLDLELASAPEWLLAGLRPPRPGRGTVGFSWRRRRGGLRVTLRWSRPYDVHRALADALRAGLRTRPWEQVSGPEPPAPEPPAIVTAIANPYGRTLRGAATRYRLGWPAGRAVLYDEAGQERWYADPAAPEAAAARGGFDKYAVVRVDAAPPAELAGVLCTLAACGIVFAAAEPAVRAALDELGLVTVGEGSGAAAVDDLPGYARSVEAARRMAIRGDAILRRTALATTGGGDGGAGAGTVALPTVTAVVSTMRPDCLDQLLGYLAGQTYPALEAVIGLHGYQLSDPERERLREALPFPLRIETFAAEQPFGAVLGALSRIADGELVTKLDDDDHYGAHHVTDLVIARHTSGADLVAKGARFVHFPERDETIDRVWAAPEVFDVTPAGGTMLLGRGTLAQVGGWSHARRHVDADLLERVRSAGGLVYRTHALEYVYVRRTTGHTFVTGIDELRAHGERVYPGLPPEIIRPDVAPPVRV